MAKSSYSAIKKKRKKVAVLYTLSQNSQEDSLIQQSTMGHVSVWEANVTVDIIVPEKQACFTESIKLNAHLVHFTGKSKQRKLREDNSRLLNKHDWN